MIQSTIPAEIEQEHFGGVLKYRFPRRSLGRIQQIGGMVLIGMSLIWMAVPWIMMRDSIFSSRPALPFLIFILIWDAGLLSPLILGLMLWKGHTQITLDGNYLIAAERFGVLRWRRKFRVDRITRLVAGYSADGKLRINGKPSERMAELAKCGVLIAHSTKRKPGFVLAGYPTAWTVAVGEQLAEQLKLTLEHDHHQAD